MKTIDLGTLQSVDDHPTMQEKHRILAAAREQQSQIDDTLARAERDLAAQEDAAATGRRDEKRLQRARETVRECREEHRIAQRRVELAEQAVTTGYRATCEELERRLNEAYAPAVQRLDAALAETQQRSHDVATLEEASSRLFGGNPYRGLPGSPLFGAAWWKEFGGPRTTVNTETRYLAWRKFCRRWLVE
jgi:hypothetical protein